MTTVKSMESRQSLITFTENNAKNKMLDIKQVIGITTFLLLFNAQAIAERLNIAVASNFTATLRSLSQHYMATCSCEINIISGSTGKLYFQITQAAPFDAFFSADEITAQRLVDDGLAFKDSYFVYAKGILAIYGETDLSKASKIAIANPKLAPYGKAAMEYLNTLDNAAEIRSKLVYAENVAQAFQFSWTGATQSSFVPLSYSSRKMKKELALQPIPASTYSPILQAAVINNDSQSIRQFFAYLKSTEAKKIIRNAGYEVATDAQ